MMTLNQAAAEVAKQSKASLEQYLQMGAAINRLGVSTNELGTALRKAQAIARSAR